MPDESYRAAVETLGEQATVELVGVLGYYTLVAMTLNAFEIDPPPMGTSRWRREAGLASREPAAMSAIDSKIAHPFI